MVGKVRVAYLCWACLAIGTLLLAAPYVTRFSSPSLYNSVLFYTGQTVDAWGNGWQIRSSPGLGGVAYSVGPDGKDDEHFTPYMGRSDRPPPPRLVDDVWIMWSDDKRLLRWMRTLIVLRVSAGLAFALSVVWLPLRVRRRWLAGVGCIALLGFVFSGAVDVFFASNAPVPLFGYQTVPPYWSVLASVVGACATYVACVVGHARRHSVSLVG